MAHQLVINKSSREFASSILVFDDFLLPEPKRYPLSDGGSIEAANLSRAERDTQVEAMREWFLQNFEDPAENTACRG